ncbi:nitroreductase/quinone reductase family protein [Actinoplanes aureus]|uniref:Nitroreductase family deazaflavin-dependent oxidoreductase n=1 Tax=Actinoplanes aureus TaxID=2792083 RepID=A0A931FYM6_9ACTN|nr:nitroreductase/quinone reductase family protein [Actinoplanes aureus]MBG0563907.1 nitroreductase family deazaflavin-dependent oxidoreductase [Actinoplanes aureus]
MWRRLWRAAGGWPGFTPIARRMVRLDRWLGRVTGGRVVALGMAPSLMLTTTGRRSGLPRSQPLQYVRDGDDLVVIASNWGGEKDPAWSWNLRANPSAGVTLDGREVPVTATEAEGADRERLWQLIVDQWPGYENYRTRAAHRRLRIFRLTPAR